MASQWERGTLPFGGCFGAEGLLGWSCCWGTRSNPSSAALSACPGTTGTVPEGRILSPSRPLLLPGLWGTSWPGQPRWELPGQLVHPLPLAFVRARVRRARSCPTAGEGDVWWLLLCCCQHRPWKLSFPACYFWPQHVIKSVP